MARLGARCQRHAPPVSPGNGRSCPAGARSAPGRTGWRRNPRGPRGRLRRGAEGRPVAGHRGRSRRRGDDPRRPAWRHARYSCDRRGGSRGRPHHRRRRRYSGWSIRSTARASSPAARTNSSSNRPGVRRPHGAGSCVHSGAGRTVYRDRRPRRLEAHRPGEVPIRTRAVPERPDGGRQPVAWRPRARSTCCWRDGAWRAGAQLRLRAEVLPPGRGGCGSLPALRAHHGMGYRRAAGGAGGRRRARGTTDGAPLGYGKPGWENPHFICWGR